MEQNLLTAHITSLTHDGRGVAEVNGKKIFIENALPGEEVALQITKNYKTYSFGQALEILTASPDRVTPKCPHFAICGGCCLQHLSHEKQISFKNNLLKEQLEHNLNHLKVGSRLMCIMTS